MSVPAGSAVHAVIVTFRPDVERLTALLQAVLPQVSATLIIDNGAQEAPVERLIRSQDKLHCTVVATKENVGLAAAQNEGINRALEAGADYVLLLDQDSVPGAQMVARLVHAIQSGDDAGRNIAAAGPVFIDDETGQSAPFVQYGLFGFRRVPCGARFPDTVASDVLISSGMLIPAAVLRTLGPMDESLFIDHVDTEWCLRARSAGYQLLGVCGAHMLHRLGEGSTRVIGGRRLFNHSPTRRYYSFRNSILLYRRSYPAIRWKVAHAARLCCMLLLIAVVSSPRRQTLRAAFKGIADGIRGRSGALSVPLEQ